MARKMLWLMMSILMVAVLVLTSCQSATVDETEGQTVKGKVTEQEQPKEEEEKDEVAEPVSPVKDEGPQYGGRLVVADHYAGVEPESWDPHDLVWNTGGWAGIYMQTLMAGDLQKGPRGTNEFPFLDLEYIPLTYLTGTLAESWDIEAREPQGYKYTFHLRQDVMWPEKPGVMASREFVAEDVVFAWERFYADDPFDVCDTIQEIFAEDKHTVIVLTNDWVADWEKWFGYRWVMAMIYPPELVEAGIEDWKNAVGTGPFMLDDYVPGASVSFVKNPVYYGKEVIDGKEYDLPFIDRVDRVLIIEMMTRLAAVRTGKIDMIEPVEARHAQSLRESNPELLETSGTDTNSINLQMRFDQAPTDDIRVRQAMMLGLDMPAITDMVYEGEATLTSFPFHPDWPPSIYTPLEDMSDMVQSMFLGPRDVDEAKRLLSEAGYPNGFKLRLLTGLPGGANPTEDITDMCTAYWADLGIEIEVMQKDPAALVRMLGEHDYDIVISSRTCVPPRVVLFDYRSPDYLWNSCVINDERFNEMQDLVQYEPDQEISDALLKEAGIRFKEQVAYCGFGATQRYGFWWPWLKNYFGERSTSYFNPATIWASLWIDQDMRMEMVGR